MVDLRCLRGWLIAMAVAALLLLVPSSDNDRLLRNTESNRSHLQKPHTKYTCPFNGSEQENNNSSQPPPLIRLDEYATLLHLGKGGGGTIRRDRMQRWWLVKTQQCHHKPCNDDVSEKTLQQDPKHGFLVNVRDPVDRLVSSFYWPILQFCDPAGNDPRIHVHTEVVHREQTHCTTGGWWKRVFKVNYYEFDHDINQLGAALCNVSNSTRHKRARQSIEMNVHAPQTDMAMEWLHNLTHFEDDAMFAQRRDMVQHRAFCEEHGDATAETQSFAHTSFSSSTIRPTPATEQCLVNYLRKDYAVLPQIQEQLCKSDDCRQGIQSILDRRQSLFLAN